MVLIRHGLHSFGEAVGGRSSVNGRVGRHMKGQPRGCQSRQNGYLCQHSFVLSCYFGCTSDSTVLWPRWERVIREIRLWRVAKQRQRRSYLHLSVAGDKTDNSGTQRAYVIGFYLVKSVKIGFSISFIFGNFGLWIRISGKAFSFMTSHLSERKRMAPNFLSHNLGNST